MSSNISRSAIEEQLQNHQSVAAIAELRKLFRSHASSSIAAYILNCRERFPEAFAEAISLRPAKLAILRSFTVEPVVPFLRAGALLDGIDLEIRTGEFNAYAQEILNSQSWLYSDPPSIVVLAIQTRDLAPQLWDEASALKSEDSRAVARSVAEQIRSWISMFRARSSATLIVHSFEKPAYPSRGVLDAQIDGGQNEAIDELNSKLREIARSFPNVAVLDYDALVSRHGRIQWHDELKWITARMPISNGCLHHLASEWLRFVYAVAGPVRKVLVTDLDNTLWGGLAGEDGLAGVQLGPDYPGCAYRAVQRALLDLRNRGVLLAVNSKNNREDAMRILEKHSQMLLAPSDFVCTKINWNDKVQNLRDMAQELNLGTDSFVFLDDNPVERARIRLEMPEVEVIELPADPMQFEAAIRESVVFDRLSLTQEDLERTELYRAQTERSELAANSASLEDFYRSLKQVVSIAPLQPENLTRVAQLTRKTNQFNVTTRRYTEKQIQDFLTSPDWAVYSVQVEDRFGDNGIVGVVITHTDGQICDIDTFLLSCRVIGRTVETAILSALVADATRQGLTAVTGRFIPTAKNAPAAQVFKSHGFALDAIDGDEVCYRFDLGEKSIECPEWIDLRMSPRDVPAYAL